MAEFGTQIALYILANTENDATETKQNRTIQRIRICQDPTRINRIEEDLGGEDEENNDDRLSEPSVDWIWLP